MRLCIHWRSQSGESRSSSTKKPSKGELQTPRTLTPRMHRQTVNMQNQKTSNFIIQLVLWFSTWSSAIDALAIGGAQIPSPATLATDPTIPLPRGSIHHVVIPTGTGGWWDSTSAQAVIWLLWIFNVGSCVVIVTKARAIWALV